MLRTAALPLLLLAAAAPARGQVLVVDEGTFTLTSDTVRVGREDFSIRRAADGSYIAQGNLLRGDSRASVALSTDSAGYPLRFQFERYAGGRLLESVSGELRRGLWSGRAVREGVESGREFRLPDAVVAADGGIAHETWFLLRFGGRPGVRWLAPRTFAIGPLVVEAAGRDTVAIGFDAVPATRWVVRQGAGGGVEREAWVDAAGRLLRVRLPREGLEALRDEPPPETTPDA